MKAEDLEIGDVVRYEHYHSGVKFGAYARIKSKLDVNNYFALSDLMDHKRVMGFHHKDSIIAKILATGEEYKEIRLETHIRRFSYDDSFLFADPKNHCPQCAKKYMNRELKFRVWDKINKTFYYVDYPKLHLQNGNKYTDGKTKIYAELVFGSQFPVELPRGSCYPEWRKDNLIIQQFTGFRDCKNRDVYDGDVVLDRKNANVLDKSMDVFVVEYDQTYSAFILQNKNGKYWNWMRNISNYGEIIGNIFEPLSEPSKITPVKPDPEDDLDLSRCENCDEMAWDGRICHACGAKDI